MSEEIDWLGLSSKQYVANWGPQTRYRKGAGRNEELRKARHEAHKVFDQIWRKRLLTRTEAYYWLAVQMGWPRGDCHMGMMTAAECAKVIELSRAYLGKRAQIGHRK